MNEIMKENAFYNRKIFVLVDVSFTKHKGTLYTYVAHVKQNVAVDDWVVVPTGIPENIFNADCAYDHGQVAKVKRIRPIEQIMKSTFMIRPIVSVIDHEIYDKVSAARHSK